MEDPVNLFLLLKESVLFSSCVQECALHTTISFCIADNFQLFFISSFQKYAILSSNIINIIIKQHEYNN